MTYQPSPSALPPLPAGWTEHKAPTGHTYYYNAETKVSTYRRPGVAPFAPVAPVAPAAPAVVPAPASAPVAAPMNPAMSSFVQHQMVPQINLSDPAVANAFMAQYAQTQQPQQGQRGGFGAGGRGGMQSRPRPQPVDKPRSKVAIPGCEPWILVYTKYGRRFVYNPVKNASYWRIPEKLMPAILELDQARIRQKAEGKTTEQEQEQQAQQNEGTTDAEKASSTPATEGQQAEAQHDYDSSEYEEVEVTDDEGAEDGDQDAEGSSRKRQRTEEPTANDAHAEFTEADIAAQLAAMGAEYGDDAEMGEDWEEGDEGLPLSESDARELFKDLLNDFNINPYSPWDKLMEEGKIFDDARYTVLPTTKARKEVWEEWSRAKIQELKERRAKEEKKDPRIPYLAFLQAKATPKLYWPEFRRKYKKEEPMKDPKLSDKDREKYYREHINRLKLPQATLKADLKKLLASVPPSQLNNQTPASHLPPQVLCDIRYISLDPQVRDPFIEAYIQGLGPPPEAGEVAAEAEGEEEKKAREERRKREKVLQERERAVAEEKRRQEKRLQYERARLREKERELVRAMHVGKKGLVSQLAGGTQTQVEGGGDKAESS
ncbi:Pre-mRNA-splicing factor dre4 [Achaetomium macrosporum]|uniref:Pre-mRNA-splicing factor dre4 n=1 Tax=Achaetomium macrosporum TaxID=79813 RepID=A0AAN7C7W3_9PEZI|nr:Pre-mRNA-splicing factor dre4 [Achaetomium macrosporum]